METSVLYCMVLLLLLSTLAFTQANPSDQAQQHSFKQQITKDHVLEELEHQINTKDQKDMTDRELQFYYFKLHDFDNNNMLDGLEIVKAIKHQEEEHGAETVDNAKSDLSDDQSLIQTVDDVLRLDDVNKDGYISFAEFVAMQVEPKPGPDVEV